MDRNNSILDCIYKSILEKNIQQVETLLEVANVNPNEILPDRGINILHLAAGLEPEEYSERISEIIISHGGNPNERSDDGMTPLHVAAAWGRLGTVRMLIAHGGNVDCQDEDGKTPLDYANEHHHLDVIKYLKDEINCQLIESISPDKYRLKLDKIIVRNGMVEGEYIPAEVADEVMKVEAFKKSEIISEWFARSPKLRSSFCVYDEEVTPINKIKCHVDSESDEKRSSISMVTANDIQLSFKNRLSRNLEVSKQSSLYRSCIASFNEVRNSFIDSYDIPQLNELSSQEIEAEDHGSSSDHSLSGVVPIEFTKTSYNKLFSVFFKENDVEDTTKQSGVIKCPGSFEEIEPIHPPMGSEIHILNKKTVNLQDSTILTSHRSDKSYDIQADCSSSEESQISDCFNKAIVTNDDFIDSFEKVSLRDINYINNRQFGTTSKDTDDKANILIIRQSNESLNSSTNVMKCTQNRSACIVNETLASVAEEYKYEDEQAGVALIEKRILVTPVPLPSESNDGSVALSIASTASSLPIALDYDTDALRKELISLGAAAGPITMTTKRVYLKRLQKLRKDERKVPVTPAHQLKAIRKTYSLELEKTFRDVNWNSDLSSYITLERQIADQFSEPDPNKRWREGITKSSFTYLLLDPRSTQNLPCRAEITPRPEIWHSFIDSIFYIGKGKRSRPYSHLYQAVTLYNAGQTISEDKKVQYILDIWKENFGVVCLHIFQNVIPVEAYSREAAMIEVIGLKNLKNVKSGNYYGLASTWPLKQKKLLGVYLLYKAMLIFLSEGERQLRPADIG